MAKQLIGLGIIGLLLAGFFALRSHYQFAADRGTATPQSEATALVMPVPEQTLYKAARSRYQPSALTHEFETTADLGAFYQRHVSREPSGEQLYFLQQALRKCTDFLDGGPMPRLTRNDPLYEQRSAALLALSERCRGFQALDADAVKIARSVLKERAAASDHPRIQAEQLMWAFTKTPRVDLFKKANELARTRDPYVLLHISVLYEMTGRDGDGVRLEAGSETITGRTAATAWHLVACDYGLNCSSRELTRLCAVHGRCGATSVDDYAQRYRLTGAEYAQAQQLRKVIRQGLAQKSELPNLVPQPLARASTS